MSRIAKIPVTIAKGVTVAITEADVTVKGPVGEVKMHILPLVKVTEENGHLHFEQLDESRDANMNVARCALSSTIWSRAARPVSKSASRSWRRLPCSGSGR